MGRLLMKYLVLVAAVFALTSSNAAVAQGFTAAQRAACKRDYEKFCKGTMPGGGSMLACLNKQHDQLFDACQQVVDAQKR
jgi:Spy/CpxP family protein refolding chaperone